jgi:hypothetical protein
MEEGSALGKAKTIHAAELLREAGALARQPSRMVNHSPFLSLL